MRYIQSFNASGDVQTALDNGSLGKPYVAYVESDGAIDWNTKNPPPDYSKLPLTFNIISAGTIVWSCEENGSFQKTISYSKDNGVTWTDIRSTTDGVSIDVEAGETIQFKGNNSAYSDLYGRASYFYKSTAIFEAYGNIMSLNNSTGFATATTLTIANNFIFAYMFVNCTGLTSVENLVLPATTLSKYCYNSMFNGCSNIEIAPELPATSTIEGCYAQMFRNCTNLRYIKCLSNYNQNDSFQWAFGVSSTGTFVKRADVNWSTGMNGIPNGWTVIDA